MALETLAGASAEIRLLLTDLTMPRLNGYETAREAVRLYPELPVVVMSGFSEETASERFASLPIQGYLQKPFSVQALEKTCAGSCGRRAVIGAYRPAPSR